MTVLGNRVLRARLVAAAALLPVLLAGCGVTDHAGEERAGLLPADEVAGGGQPNAAAALSVLGGPVQDDNKSEYARAVDCAASLGFVAQKLENSALLNSEQQQAMAQAIAFFRSQAFSAAGAEGKSTRAVNADLVAARTAASNNAAGAVKTTTACVRGLGGDGQQAEVVTAK